MVKNMANYPSREHAPEKHATKNNRRKIPKNTTKVLMHCMKSRNTKTQQIY